jgi:hypothetical protein
VFFLGKAFGYGKLRANYGKLGVDIWKTVFFQKDKRFFLNLQKTGVNHPH